MSMTQESTGHHTTQPSTETVGGGRNSRRDVRPGTDDR